MMNQKEQKTIIYFKVHFRGGIQENYEKPVTPGFKLGSFQMRVRHITVNLTVKCDNDSWQRAAQASISSSLQCYIMDRHFPI